MGHIIVVYMCKMSEVWKVWKNTCSVSLFDLHSFLHKEKEIAWFPNHVQLKETTEWFVHLLENDVNRHSRNAEEFHLQFIACERGKYLHTSFKLKKDKEI